MNIEINLFKLEIFIPQTHLKVLQQALQQVDAGHIGNYDCCMSYSKVTGVMVVADRRTGNPEQMYTY